MEIPIMEVTATVAVLTLGVGWPLSFLGYNLSICSSNLALIFSYFSINNYYDLFGKKSTFLISELDEEALISFIIFWNFFTDFQRWNNRSPSMRRYIIRLKKSENPLIYIPQDQSGRYSAKWSNYRECDPNQNNGQWYLI